MRRSTLIHLRGIFFLAVSALWTACAGDKPADILSREEMVDILQEVYISEEKVNRLGLSRDSARAVADLLRSRLFETAAVNDTVFRKSLDYYTERPSEMELIYTALVDSLQLREQRAPFRPETP